MKLASAAYPIEWHARWDDYADKLERWVAEAAGADLIVFPEYAGFEAAMVGAPPAGAGTAEWLERSAAAMPAMLDHLARLAARRNVHILAGSGAVKTARGPVSRAHLLTPDGRVGYQDKQCLTPWERRESGFVAGEPLTDFETDLGRIGVLICYDSEFPLLARALDCDLMLVPSCTELEHGASRVRLAARARALEGQRYTLVAPLLGTVTQNAFIETNRGRAGVYAPPDTGFPADGIVAEGGFDVPGWVTAEVDLAALPARRAEAHVAVAAHWEDSAARARTETREMRPIGN